MVPLVLISITFFALLFGIIYLFLSTRHRERIALIEKNADAKIFYPDKNVNKESKFVIKLGLLAAGIGIGIGVGVIIISFIPNNAPAIILSTTFLFGGVGLFSSYYVARKAKED